MTSQPATTMRNLTNVGILIGTDMVDQVNKAIYKGITGDASQIKTFIPNMTAVIRGLSFNNTEAKDATSNYVRGNARAIYALVQPGHED